MANKLPEASPHGEELREAVARAMREHMIRVGVVKSWMEYADAALSLIQHEIDRRVAEEKVRLLEALRVPSEGMIEAGDEIIYALNQVPQPEPQSGFVFRAMLAAFQQENSDAATDR